VRVRDSAGLNAIDRAVTADEDAWHQLNRVAVDWNPSEQAVLDPAQPLFATSEFANATLLQYAQQIASVWSELVPSGSCATTSDRIG
jgi:hypothetical protein